MSGVSEERAAGIESVFRTINENIIRVATKLGGRDSYQFICECSRIGCIERIGLTVTEYHRVRQDGTHFILAPGHEDIEVEDVIAHRQRFVVVQKQGAAGVVADEEDPQS